MLKVCFWGLGSIGCRHLKNFDKIAKSRQIETEIHALRTSKKKLNEEINGIVDISFDQADDLHGDYDIAFITNPTSKHYESIQLMKSKTKHMFIEKPIFDHVDYNIESLMPEKDGFYYVARPLVHSSVYQKIKEITENERVYNARAICSSYLPDWRPNLDYRQVYSAKKELGGGVSIDLIHEWDYLTDLFGFPTEVLNMQAKVSDLEIDSEDLSIYIGKYQDKLVEVHLDYFGREKRRSIELLTARGTITGDFINKTIRFSDGRQTLHLDQNEDMYQNEMEYFLDKILYPSKAETNIPRALGVLKLTMGRKS